MSNGKRAVTLAIIKQADENMDDMKQAIGGTMNYFQSVYPDIEFTLAETRQSFWIILSPTCNKTFRWAFYLSVS